MDDDTAPLPLVGENDALMYPRPAPGEQFPQPITPTDLLPTQHAPLPPSPLDALRAKLQPIAAELLCDVAYWEMLKRTSSPRTFLEFVRFAYAADQEGRAGGSTQQVIVNAPFPRGPLDVLPPHMRIR
jgi:hypothetical protein